MHHITHLSLFHFAFLLPLPMVTGGIINSYSVPHVATSLKLSAFPSMLHLPVHM